MHFWWTTKISKLLHIEKIHTTYIKILVSKRFHFCYFFWVSKMMKGHLCIDLFSNFVLQFQLGRRSQCNEAAHLPSQHLSCWSQVLGSKRRILTNSISSKLPCATTCPRLTYSLPWHPWPCLVKIKGSFGMLPICTKSIHLQTIRSNSQPPKHYFGLLFLSPNDYFDNQMSYESWHCCSRYTEV